VVQVELSEQAIDFLVARKHPDEYFPGRRRQPASRFRRYRVTMTEWNNFQREQFWDAAFSAWAPYRAKPTKTAQLPLLRST
jgi:hypothetical protein